MKTTTSSRAATATGGRQSTLCIGLLIVAICLQLYVISLWLAPHQQPLPACAPAAARESHPGHTVRVITASENADASLPDSTSAITALHLLQKFIRQHRDRLDSTKRQASSVSVTVDALPGHAHAGGEGQGEDAEEELDVGKESVPKSHTHADSAHDHHAGDSHDEAFLASKPGLYRSIWLDISKSWAEDVLHSDRYQRLSAEEKKRWDQCEEWQSIGHVLPDESWGQLPEHLHKPFNELACSDLISLRMAAQYVIDHPDLYDRLHPVPADRPKVRAEAGYEDKVVAVIVAMTTRTITVTKLDDLALFRDLLPSFVRTVEAGFEYWVYLGYDQGDPWLDDAEHLQACQAWFDQHVAGPLRERGITAKLVLATWENRAHTPGPTFNYVTGIAYADGATWIYRINDDVLFETPWARAFVDALTEMGPPYGVVGPACGQGATHILVVDFTHRTHHDIFPTHYPPVLQAWFLDNWISQVYGRQRTKRVNTARITHLTEAHKTRYKVTGYSQYYRGEVVRGRAMLEEYLSHTPGMQEQLKAYRADSFSYHTR